MMNLGELQASVRCFESLNNSCLRPISYPFGLRVPLYLLLAATVVLIVGGNLLVISIIACSQQLQTATNWLIMSLSVAGLLLGLLVLPPSLVRSLESCWYFGEVFCAFHAAADIVLCNTTVWHLTFISIDRYLAICHPMRYRHRATGRLHLAMIVSSWSLSSVFGFTITLRDELRKKANANVDVGDLRQPCVGSCPALHAKEIGPEYFIVFFFIPVSIIVSLYSRVFFIAHRHAKVIHGYSHNPNPKPLVPSATKDLKATKTLAVVIGNFLLCWTPFFMCNVIDPAIDHSIPTLLYEVLMWLAYLNSMFNPIIYAFFYSWFRQSARLLLNKVVITTP